jgi:hypothetical protein
MAPWRVLLGFVYFVSMLTLAQFGLTLPALSIKIGEKAFCVINLHTSASLARIGSYSGVEIVLVSSFAPAIIAGNDNFCSLVQLKCRLADRLRRP